MAIRTNPQLTVTSVQRPNVIKNARWPSSQEAVAVCHPSLQVWLGYTKRRVLSFAFKKKS